MLLLWILTGPHSPPSAEEIPCTCIGCALRPVCTVCVDDWTCGKWAVEPAVREGVEVRTAETGCGWGLPTHTGAAGKEGCELRADVLW